MADEHGKLTIEETQKILNWLRQFPASENAKCPLCGSENWMVAENLVQPLTLTNMAVQIGGHGYPLVMLISNPCGYTRFVNAVMIGLIPAQFTQTSEESQEKAG